MIKKIVIPSTTPFMIKHIRFEGGGLSSYIRWGGDYWDYGWPEIDVIADGQFHNIFRDEHADFLAKQKASLDYKLTLLDLNQYKLEFSYFTESYNSLSTSWGSLTIGSAFNFSD